MTLDVRLIGPAEETAPFTTEDEVLDCRPARSGTGPPQPGRVQPVVLDLPDEQGQAVDFPALTLLFSMTDPDLDARVTEAADLAYVSASSHGLIAFNEALHGTGYAPATGSMLLPARRDDPEPRYRDATSTPNRNRLIASFDDYLKRLPERQRAVIEAVQAHAATTAIGRLSVSRQQVSIEADRYLSVGAGRASAVLDSRAPNRLTGPDVVGLIRDLLDIARARADLDAHVRRIRGLEQSWQQTKLAILADDRAKSGRNNTHLTDDQLRQLGRDLAAIPDSPEVRAARQQVGDARLALAQLVTERAARRPVLHRLWNTAAPQLATDLIRGSRGGNIVADRAIVADSAPLRDLIVTTLRDSAQAASELAGKIQSKPALVWRFRALVEDAVAGLDGANSDFAHRVASDRIAEEEPARTLKEVSTWLGWAQLAAALSGAAPAAIALGVVQVVVDIGAWIEKLVATWDQQLGENAFLRPADRLDVPPGYSGLVMDALMVGLNVWFLR